MGKDFVSASREDNVMTPFSMSQQFYEQEYFDYSKRFLDPACGINSMVTTLREKNSNINIEYFDINHNEKIRQINFFNIPISEKTNYIITNPPYSKLNRFISKAKQIATEKFAFLCKITHLGGKDRFDSGIYKDPEYPLVKIYMFTRQANLKFFNKEKELKILRDRIKIYSIGTHSYNDLSIKIKETEKLIDYSKLREDGMYPAGMYYYCWLVWEKREIDPNFFFPEFRWIDNNNFILRKNK